MEASVALFYRNHPEFLTDGEIAVGRGLSLNAVAFTSDEGASVEYIDLQEGEINDPLMILLADELELPEVEDDDEIEVIESSEPAIDTGDWSFI